MACAGDVFDCHWRSESRGGWSAITKVAIHLHGSGDTIEILLNQTNVDPPNGGGCCQQTQCQCDPDCCGQFDKIDDFATGAAGIPGAAEECCIPGCCQEFDPRDTPVHRWLRAKHNQDERSLALVSKPYYTINGVIPATDPATIGGYPWTVGNGMYKLFLGANNPITVADTYQSFRLTLDMHGSVAHTCKGTCGDWKNGGISDRDGTPIEDDPSTRRLEDGISHVAVGDEWYVQGDDPEYFEVPKGSPPEFSPKELNPEWETRAQDACKDVDDPDAKAACIFDIMLTEDDGWAETERYKEPEIQPAEGNPECRSTGFLCRFFMRGECIYRCNRAEYRCYPRLCRESSSMRASSDSSSAFLFGKRNRDGFEEGCSCAVKRLRT